MQEAKIRRGDWADPEAGKVRFGDYASSWISDHVIKPRTEGLYRSQVRNHLLPTFAERISATFTRRISGAGGRNVSTRGRMRPGGSGNGRKSWTWRAP
jgi:hypothetical protein